MSTAWERAADILDPPKIPSRWYCDRLDCNGEPHEGWHWCDHRLPHPSGQEFWQCRHARANQRPPTGNWRIWLCISGRGFGKTRSGAEWIVNEAKQQGQTNWAAVAPTRDDLKATCFEGDSGILRALGMSRNDTAYNKTDMTIRLPNNSMIRGLSAEKPERTRGPNLAGAWLDELAIWNYVDETWNDLMPALRRGDARIMVTTTPRSIPLIKELVHRNDGSVQITHGTIWDNAANLSEVALKELQVRWEGTRQARQELYGELLEDEPGALWSQATIDATRCSITGLPDFQDLLKAS